MKLTRNEMMLKGVVEGYKYRQIADIFGVTIPRVQQIVFKTLKCKAPSIYKEVIRRPHRKTNELRKYKNRLTTILFKNETL